MKQKAAKLRKSAVVLMLLCLAFLTTACWSSYEINDLAVVELLGIDQSDDGGYRLSALIIRPGSTITGSGAENKGKQSEPFIVTAEGKSLFESMRSMSIAISKRLYWGHLEAVIFGKAIAETKAWPTFDVMFRQHEFRKNISVLVTKGKAESILKVKPKLEGSLGAEIHGLVRFADTAGNVLVNDISHFNKTMYTPTSDIMTGIITDAANNGIIIHEVGKRSPSISIAGSGVFKNGKIVGWLTPQETRGVLFISGQLKHGVIRLPCPNGQEGAIAVEILKTNSERTLALDGDKPEIKVNVDMNGQISEIGCSGIKVDVGQMDQLSEQLKKQVEKEMSTGLEKAQKEWGADVFGFGEMIYKWHPKKWKKMKDNWASGELQRMTVRFNVNARLTRSGLIIDTPNTGGE